MEDIFQYWYKATVVRIIDADTLELDIDLGMQITRRETIRLNRVNAWEIRGVEREFGLEAKAFVAEQIPVGTTVQINTFLDRSGKYGRLLVDLYLEDGTCLNDVLVMHEHAKYVSY